MTKSRVLITNLTSVLSSGQFLMVMIMMTLIQGHSQKILPLTRKLKVKSDLRKKIDCFLSLENWLEKESCLFFVSEKVTWERKVDCFLSVEKWLQKESWQFFVSEKVTWQEILSVPGEKVALIIAAKKHINEIKGNWKCWEWEKIAPD